VGEPYSAACRMSALDAVCQGAAGYHAWAESEKLRHYGRARENLAMTAASLWVFAELSPRQSDARRLLAHSYEEIAPGLGGLARRASRRKD